MAIGSYVAVYFIVWWVCLFIVLPIGARSQIQDGHVARGTDPGAPTNPRIGRTVLITTVLAAVATPALLYGMQSSWLQAYWG